MSIESAIVMTVTTSETLVNQEQDETGNGDTKVNNWSEPGPAAFDFRSTY